MANPVTVLLVEDEKTISELIELVLRNEGFHVLVAATSQEALAQSAGHPGIIQLLITDWNLPDLIGPDLAHQLVQARPDMKVIYMSGTEKNVHAPGLVPGSFLLKPFLPSVVLDKVQAILGR